MNQADLIAKLAQAWEITELQFEAPGRLLTLTLISQGASTDGMRVRFAGVSSLQFEQTSSNLAVALQIVDIADRGWEDAKLKVTDPPNGLISFLCRRVDAI